MDARDKLLKIFRESPSVTVFLISLKAGGVALNLTVASQLVNLLYPSIYLLLNGSFSI